MANYLTDRHAIAKAMNFGKYPVIVLNRENQHGYEKYGETDYCTGQKVNVAWDSEDPRYAGISCRCEVYLEDGKYGLGQGATCLKADFGYTDVMEDAEWANAVTVHRGQKVVLVENWPSKKICTVRMMKVSDRMDRFCQTVAWLTDEE